ncbi:MAG TPA: long-chain fatty acid--CoA ligase [Acidimicrobiia bacterium]|nr:long-chain fatty acid--CoA ligase [Acidimicrobiia bacterium]
MFRNAASVPGRPGYLEKVGGVYRAVDWQGYATGVRRAGRALVALGFAPGQYVAILGFNRPEWVITYLGAMAAGGAAAGIYLTSSADEVAYVVGHAEAPVAVVEGAEQLAKVLSRRGDLPALRWVVTMRGASPANDPMVLSWEEFLAKGERVADGEIDARLDARAGGDPATLIYTSGTTGPPKGVVLTHDNLTWTADQAQGVFSLSSDDVLISYLPLSHVAEQMYAVHVAISFGYSVAFAESVEALRANIAEVRPTLFFGVPRVWEKFAAGVGARLAEVHGVRARLARRAMGTAARVAAARNEGREPGSILGLQYRLARRLVLDRVKEALGLDRCHFAVSGAAPAEPATLAFLAGLDLPVYEVYGLSETAGPVSWNRPGRTRFGTVGPAYPGVEIRIADDGEIMVKGGNVFTRYHRDPAATAAAFQGGWFATGDLGALDPDGFLSIVGRKKDLIVTAGGKNVAPAPLEAALKQHPLVGETMVIGDRRPYLCALVSLDPEASAAYAAAHEIAGPVHRAEPVLAEVSGAVERVNARVSRGEQIKRFCILARPLSIEQGELTGTLKVRRRAVEAHFAAEIEAMYR